MSINGKSIRSGIKMIQFDKIKYIGFDADDTLWINELYYHNTEKEFAAILSDYLNEDDLKKELLDTEMNNVKLFGFGTKGFTISMIETAIRVTNNSITADKIAEIINLGKLLLNSPVNLFDGTEKVLKKLQKKYKLIVATKGDLFDQERKLRASKLKSYLHHIEIMSNKNETNYKKLLDRLEIKPEEFLMIGNSLKSDILPVLNIEGSAIYIPYHLTWEFEKREIEVFDKTRFLEIDKITDLLKIIN
jgi:putative hydrolase of the HAD superfamily